MPKEVNPRIILTGGGTGGHRYPLVAVWEEIRRQAPLAQALYVGGEHDMKRMSEVAPELPRCSLATGKLRRYVSWENVRDLGRVVRGYRQAVKIVREYQPQVVMAKGGYVSVPLAWAAARAGIPVVTHESDAVLGLANRLVGRSARVICTSFEESIYPEQWRSKMIHTGPIIRSELVVASRRRSLELKKWRGLAIPSNKPVILVLGGSQGAAQINDLVFQALPALLKLGLVVIHQTGPAHYETALTRRQRLPALKRSGYQVADYLQVEEMGRCLRRANLAISRAGSSIFELALFGLPSILIPLSTSAGGHQAKNATYFAQRDAAVVLDGEKASATDLVEAVKQVINPGRAQVLSDNVKRLGQPKGAKLVAEQVLQYV